MASDGDRQTTGIAAAAAGGAALGTAIVGGAALLTALGTGVIAAGAAALAAKALRAVCEDKPAPECQKADEPETG